MSKVIHDCPECQALEDGKVLFIAIEELAQREDIDPHRMVAAIRELLVGWLSIVWKAWPEGIGDIGGEAEELAQAFSDSIKRAIQDKDRHLH